MKLTSAGIGTLSNLQIEMEYIFREKVRNPCQLRGWVSPHEGIFCLIQISLCDASDGSVSYLSRAGQSSRKVTLPLCPNSGGRRQKFGPKRKELPSNSLNIGVCWDKRGRTAIRVHPINEPSIKVEICIQADDCFVSHLPWQCLESYY